MKLFVTGGNGQLGKALQEIFPDGTYTDVSQLDITDPDAVNAVQWDNYDALINAAAFTAVDKAEELEEVAHNVNAVGPELLANAAAANRIPIVHISTDYVYDGATPEHTEDEEVRPLSVYGKTKAAGDFAVASANTDHFIVRTSWVVGNGPNFVRTMLALGKDRDRLSVVNDQIGRLTFADTLAAAVQHLLETKPKFGIYHMSNSGDPASWADIAREVFSIAGMDVTISDTTTEEFAKDKSPFAPRPHFSTLNLDKLIATGFEPPDWKKSLQAYVEKELAL